MEPECRILTAADAPMLLNVAPGLFDRELDAGLVAEFLGDSRHHIVVVLASKQIVGFVSAVHYVHPDKRAELWINEVSVAPDYRKRGLGRRMLEKLLGHARTLGCVNAWVLTDDQNCAATRLYDSTGGIARKSVMFEFAIGTGSSNGT